MEPKPPSRPPHYGDNEMYGWPVRDCARNLISTLSGWTRDPVEFKGDANGRIWHFQDDSAGRAQLLFESDHGPGAIELSIDETNWVRAEVFVGNALKLRVWIDDPYEEKEFWPDGADGVIPPNGDPPGRISKRGRWLQLRAADFSGVTDKGNGFWSVEDTLG